jgi:hypothetical protein
LTGTLYKSAYDTDIIERKIRMKKFSHEIIMPVLIILFIVLYYFINTYIVQNYSNHFNYLPYNIWAYLWTFVIAAIFSFDYFKTLKKPGKYGINIIYIILAICILTMNIPNTPLFGFLLMGKREVLLLVFWYCLFHTIRKE